MTNPFKTAQTIQCMEWIGPIEPLTLGKVVCARGKFTEVVFDGLIMSVSNRSLASTSRRLPAVLNDVHIFDDLNNLCLANQTEEQAQKILLSNKLYSKAIKLDCPFRLCNGQVMALEGPKEKFYCRECVYSGIFNAFTINETTSKPDSSVAISVSTAYLSKAF